jgi:hypothetical protein
MPPKSLAATQKSARKSPETVRAAKRTCAKPTKAEKRVANGKKKAVPAKKTAVSPNKSVRAAKSSGSAVAAKRITKASTSNGRTADMYRHPEAENKLKITPLG